MSDLVPVRRALISVSDKSGLADFATALHKEFGVRLLSTGGTAKFLRDLGLPVTDVSDVTGFPEMMDGRVKTLHPKIHGGLLALRDDPGHVASMTEHGIEPIDLVCINLYPFAKTIEKPGVTLEEAIENIDIGGPSMIRSAAKNHRFVLVVTSPDRYEKILGDLRQHGGSSCGAHRLKQSQRAFAHTAAYDGLIAKYVAKVVEPSQGATGVGGAPSRFADYPFEGAVATAAPAADQPEAVAQNTSQGIRLGQRLLDSAGGPLSAFMMDLLTAQAVSVGGTEAAAFAINYSDTPAFNLKPIQHIRPDSSTAEKRGEALRAFADLIRPCVEQDRDGAIEIGGPVTPGGPSQFCLITLLRGGDRAAVACAIILRSPDRASAKRQLTSLQFVSPAFEHYALRHPREFGQEIIPPKFVLDLSRKQQLRYGENPHQQAALYIDRRPTEASVGYAEQLHGKELSYINLLDADAALSAVKELTTPAACIVKHATPCGFAAADDLPTAFAKAFAGDPLAAFGGIVALNQTVDLATAKAITSIDKLLEVIVAPGYDADALELLRTRWKNVRLLAVGPLGSPDPAELHLHKIVGGYLVQERDVTGFDASTLKVVSARPPTPAELEDLRVAWLACKHVKSNAIVLAKDGMMLGSGAGQQDRVNACRIAVAKAAGRSQGSAAASDAFFPFPDGPEILLDAGVTAIIQPGGSVKDGETIELVNRRGAAMVLTGQRHFKH